MSRLKNKSLIDMKRPGSYDVSEIKKFYYSLCDEKHFFPAVNFDKFIVSNDLDISDFITFSDEKLIAAAALWDQNSFKQRMVKDYACGTRIKSRLMNLFVGTPILPKKKSNFYVNYFSFPIFADVHLSEMENVLNYARATSKYDLIAGVSEKDPLTSVFNKCKCLSENYHLFALSYNKKIELDYRFPIHVEISMF
jgi:hypothetical protein